MKRFIQVLENIWSIHELRDRLMITLLFLAVYRIGTFVVLPGVDRDYIQNEAEGLLGLLNMFAGGAFSRASIFALGVMPYISASIVMQLFTIILPYFQRLQKEGESGRRTITQLTRYLTVAITLVQAIAYVSTQIPTQAQTMADPLFTVMNTIIIVAGTIFIMWMGEKITDKGIGNGVSLLIMIGIIAQLPSALISEFTSRAGGQGGLIAFVVEMVFFFVVVAFTILIVQGVRRIPIQYARKGIGATSGGSARQYLPLKVNMAGVMPIIFAQALMLVPVTMIQFFPALQNDVFIGLSDYTSFGYNLLFGIMVILFTFLYTAITVNPSQIAEDLKRNNGFIPGIKPGTHTSQYVDKILSRLTFPGSVILAFIAIFPAFATIAGVNSQFAHFYGGTSLLITIGVVLDTLQQIESHLLLRKYDGLMQQGRIKGRSNYGGSAGGGIMGG